MNKILFAVAVSTCMMFASSALRAQPEGEQELISRELLFGNPTRAQVRISHDGKHLSWLAPREGVLNVWVAPIDNLEAAKPITNDRKRGISQHQWAYTNQHIIYQQDEGGNENWNIHSVDITSGKERNLTPNPKVAARISEISHKHPETILVGLNDRNPQFFDVHAVNVRTGESKLVQQNPGVINGNPVAGFMTDSDLRVRFAICFATDGGMEVYQPEADADSGGGIDKWKPFLRVPFEESMTTRAMGFDIDGQTLYMTDSRGRDTAALTALDMTSGEQKVLAEHPRADAVGTIAHPRTQQVQAVSFNFTRPEWKVIDPEIAEDMKYLDGLSDGDVLVTSRTLDDKTWTVAFTMDNGPVRFYLYDRAARSARFLFTNRDELKDLPLARMHPVVIKSRDGLELVSYLTVPLSADPDQDGRPDKPVPMVLDVHGGPWARDNWGFNPTHQWLANRGYAVLSVNFRGSTGFGKRFVNAGNKEWGGKMHDDLIDAVEWAVQSGIAERDKVAIMGGSYGGYATLVGLTFTPDVFACGVDIVGPSNINTLIQTIPPYWAPAMNLWKYRVGDHTSAEGREFLDSRSPLSKVQNIKKPLLIAQGANDPRVKQSESDQIVHAMQEKNIPVTYVLYPDEGHGFARPENRMSFFAVTEAFLAEHLGGRFQPIGEDFKGSTIQVPAGADAVPGVAGALPTAPAANDGN